MYGIFDEFLNEVLNLGTEVLIIGLLVVVVGGLVLFFLLREVYTWYFKMNKVVAMQKQQNETLTQILAELRSKK
jgi:hypothetical protein